MEALKTTALAKRDDDGFDLSGFHDAEKRAEVLAKSALLPDALRGKPADVLVVMVTGHELGLKPMQALRGIHVIKGKPSLSADLMVALCKRSEACKYFRLVSSTPKACTYETLRINEPEPTPMTWTIEMAQAANLMGNDNWKRHPDAMLRARCASALARAVYPDVVGGLYDEDEGREIEGHMPRSVTPPPTHYQGQPPAAARREEAVDAELVPEPAHDAATGELPGDAGDPGSPPQLSEEEEIAGWRQMIAKADSPAALADIGASLGAQYPKGHKIRKAINDDYNRRQAELRK
jgi:hypothetical protein